MKLLNLIIYKVIMILKHFNRVKTQLFLLKMKIKNQTYCNKVKINTHHIKLIMNLKNLTKFNRILLFKLINKK